MHMILRLQRRRRITAGEDRVGVVILRKKFILLIKPFYEQGSGPSPLERGWGEVNAATSFTRYIYDENTYRKNIGLLFFHLLFTGKPICTGLIAYKNIIAYLHTR